MIDLYHFRKGGTDFFEDHPPLRASFELKLLTSELLLSARALGESGAFLSAYVLGMILCSSTEEFLSPVLLDEGDP